MKHTSLIALGSVLIIGSVNVQAGDDWTWFAGMKDGYTAQPAVSLMFGMLDPDVDGADSDAITGIELSLNCPMLQPPTNRIRQQISYAKYDKNGVELTSIEANPHYVIETSPGLELGFGPGVGYVMAKSEGGALDDGAFALQLGASAHYTGMGPLFIGAEARYQMTTDFDGIDDNINNFRVALKVGYSF